MEISGKKDTEQENIPRIQKRRRFTLFTCVFWEGVIIKIISTLLSVKVWGLISITSISTYLLMNQYINGGEWTTVNTAVYATIFSVREIFKTTNLSDVLRKLRPDQGDS